MFTILHWSFRLHETKTERTEKRYMQIHDYDQRILYSSVSNNRTSTQKLGKDK